MSTKQPRYFLFFALMTILIGCVEEIPLETKGNISLVTVEGSINNGPGPYQVRFFTSGDFSEDQLGELQPLVLTSGRIACDDGNTGDLIMVEPGVYQTNDPTFVGKSGQVYWLEFTLSNGQQYRSHAQNLFEPVKINLIDYQLIEKEIDLGEVATALRSFIQYNAHLSVPEDRESVFFKWDFESEFAWTEVINIRNILDPVNTCYIKEQTGFNKIILFDGSDVMGEDVTIQNIFEPEVDYKYLNAYCFHLYQQTIDRDAFIYWQQVAELIERDGSLFETPPGRTIGNIFNVNDQDEEILGFFYTAAIDTSRIVIKRNEIPSAVVIPICDENKVVFSPDPNARPDPCIDCTVIANGTLEVPPYWNL